MHFNVARYAVRSALLRVALSGALAAAAGAAPAQTPAWADPGAVAGDTPRPKRAAHKKPSAAPAAAQPASAPVSLTLPAAPAAPTSWDVRLADRTLSMTFARWAGMAGWQLIWELPLDYVIDASTQIGGSFEEAVEAVANSMTSAETPMQVIFYKGNKVLRIVSKVSP